MRYNNRVTEKKMTEKVINAEINEQKTSRIYFCREKGRGSLGRQMMPIMEKNSNV